MAFIPDGPTKFVPDAPADPIGAANSAANAQEHGPVQDVIDMLKAVPSGLIPAVKGMLSGISNPYGNVLDAAQTVHAAASHPQATLTSIGSALQNATPQQVGANVVAPLVVGGAANKGIGLAGGSEAAAAEAATPAGQLGFRTTEAHPVATLAAGPTAGPTLNAQHQELAHTVLGADAGIPHGVRVSPTSLEAARVKPGELLDNGAASLPTAPLSPNAIAKIQAARGPSTLTKPTPNVAAQIGGIENDLLGNSGRPVTGAEVRATRNSLSSDANVGMQSDDADTRTIAKYKRAIVDALDQHIADTMPANSAVSPDMISNARSTLAQNYTLQDLIGKGGDINLQKLAKMHRDSPNLFTGNTRTVAQFASDHPEVTGGVPNAQRIHPVGLDTDISHINVFNPRSWIQPLVGAAGRSFLRGPEGASLAAARQAPVAGLGGEFDLRPLNELSPPPGRAFEPNQPQAATGAPTELPFEQHAFELQQPEGQAFEPHQPQLAASSGPYQPPLGLGAPFRPVAPGTSGGGLSLADEATQAAQPNYSDLAAVKSQGVPDGTVARTAPRQAPETAEGGGFVFRSPNGQTIVRKRGDALQVSASATKQSAQGAGEGTQRMVDAYNFAQANGLRLVSDTKVSNAAAKIYDRLEKMGFNITRNPVESDGKGNLLSSAGRPAFEITGGPLHESFGAAQ